MQDTVVVQFSNLIPNDSWDCKKQMGKIRSIKTNLVFKTKYIENLKYNQKGEDRNIQDQTCCFEEYSET